DKGIHSMQPKISHRYFKGREKKEIEKAAKRRIHMNEHIWDVYLKKFADVLIDKYEEKVEEALKQQQQQQQGGPDGDDDGNGGPGDDQNGSGSPGGDQSGSGWGDDAQNGQSGGSGSGQKPSQGNGPSGSGSGKKKKPVNDDLKDQIDDIANKGKDEKKGQKPGKKQNGWDKGKQPKRDPGAPEKRVGDKKKEAVVDDKKKRGGQGNGNEGDGRGDRPNKPLPEQGDTGVGDQAGQGREVDLAGLAKGDWKEFQRRCLELAPVISRMRQWNRKIRDEQKKRVAKSSTKVHDYTPIDGDFADRLDRDRVMETKMRQAAGQPPSEEGLKKFFDDESSTVSASIEKFYMIDGSGSMQYVQMGNGVTAMDTAIQSAVIGFMADVQEGIDAYIMIWGDDPLTDRHILAAPGMDLKKVGENLEQFRNGTGGGTSLEPGLVNAIERMAKHRSKPGTISGTSHVLVYSDGDIYDVEPTQRVLEKMARTTNMSVDVAVLRDPAHKDHITSMETTFEDVRKSTGAKNLGVVRGHDPNEIPLDLGRLMLRRLKQFKVKTEPDVEKRKRMRQLHTKVQRPQG
ncbi:MAG: VWA domain-containing protein, partial [Alphaproteobacteria bacterium]|nr:VWA domain-containing protein [Alphaproteobacteria bacterium]